jgi:plastocyanin
LPGFGWAFSLFGAAEVCLHDLALLLATAVPAAFAVGCGGMGLGDPVATNRVSLAKSYRFDPGVITIKAGTSVTWTNNDNFTHSVRLLDSGEVQMMKPGETVSRAFPTAGLFRYDCSLHPKDMHGSVLVGEGTG